MNSNYTSLLTEPMSLRRQTLWSMLPILVTSVISVISVPIYFKVLGAEMYAMWFYVGTLTGAFGFMDLGIGVAVGRFMGVAMGANDENAVREYWATGHAVILPMLVMFSVLFILVGVLLGPGWFKVFGPEVWTLRWAIIWGGAGLFFSYYGQMWFVLAASKLDFTFLSIIRSGFAICSSIGMIVVAWSFQNAAALMAFSAILGMAQTAILIQRGNSKYHLPVCFRNFRKGRLLEMLPYALKTFAQLLTNSILGSADRVMLGRIAPAADFAAYNVALNIGIRIQNLSQAAMGPIFCNTTRGVGGDSSRNAESIYRDSLQMLFPWYGLVIVWIAIWHEPLISFWLRDNAPAVIQAFPWIVAGCCVTALANISGAQLGPMNRVGTGLVFSLISSGMSALLVVGGWYLGGLKGAAVGFTLARLPLLVQDGMVRRLAGFSYDWKDLGLILQQGFFLCICLAFRFAAQELSGSRVIIAFAFASGFLCAGIILSTYLRKSNR